MDALIAAGASVEAQDEKKVTPLQLLRAARSTKQNHAESVKFLGALDILKWLRDHELSESQHLPVLRALNVHTSADLAALRGLPPSSLFAGNFGELEKRKQPTLLPCAPDCAAVKADLHKAINAKQRNEILDRWGNAEQEKSKDEL